MHLQSNTYLRTDEHRRYFPDWTHRSLRVAEDLGDKLEADHNSYLAGGYAEEFGYLPRPESYRGVPLIAAESADDDALRLVQWAGVHPGYPLRPYPISVEWEQTLRRRTVSRPSAGRSRPAEPEAGDRGRFFRVTERPYGREHGKLAHRLVAAVRRLLGGAVALRRGLLSPRKGHR